jgi:cysteinyl-tRNA synthetase
MSKSLGNYVTVHELIAEFPNKGEAIRLALMTAQYRQPLDFGRESIRQAEKQLNRWYKLVWGLDENFNKTDIVEATDKDISPKVLSALYDDLNTPKAIMELGKLAKNGDAKSLLASARLMGFLESDDWFKSEHGFRQEILRHFENESWRRARSQIEARKVAKENKNWELADEIRKELDNMGIVLEDHPDGTTTWKQKK